MTKTAKQIAQELYADMRAEVIPKIGIEEIENAVRKEGVNLSSMEGRRLVEATTRQVVELAA